ncbi:MAG: 30S ribosomal protein S20, partial [Desulfobacterales bacterium]
MANHKSALKRARQNDIRRLRNKSTRTRVKNVVKD